MSKCRPEAGIEFAAIADFLRSIHINGSPLDLPDEIENIHTHPRVTLNLANSVATPAYERSAVAYDLAEVGGDVVHPDIHQKLSELDQRLELILGKLEQGNK